MTIHGAIAKHQLDNNASVVQQVIRDPESAAISNKLKALLRIAAKVQAGGKQVTEKEIEDARNEGATDIEIHDTVLIAALFCLYNRYVDGLSAVTPTDPNFYKGLAERISKGYQRLPQGYDHLKKK